MGKTKSISPQNKRKRLQSTSRNFNPVNSSSESMPSTESNISTQFKIPASKQNGIDVRRQRRKRKPSRIVYQNGIRTSYFDKERFRKHFASPTCTLSYGNHPSTSLNLHPSIQTAHSAFPLRGQPEGHEDMSSNFPAKSQKFQINSKPSLHTTIPFNDPSSHCGCSGNTFQNEKRVHSSPGVSTSKLEALSSSRRTVSNFIRYSVPQPNMDRSLACSRFISLSTPLSFHTTHSTPKYHLTSEEMGNIGIITQKATQASVCPFPTLRISPIETTSQMTKSPCSIPLPSILNNPPAPLERSISPSSTVAEAGSMESTPRDTNGSSRENSQHSPEPIFSVPVYSMESIMRDANGSSRENSQHSPEPTLSVPVNSMESITRDANGSFRENSQHSPEPIFPVPVNSMENIMRCTNGSSRENSQHSSEPIHPVSLNSFEFQISTDESLDSDNGTKYSKYFVNRNPDCFPFKGNLTHPKSASENGQNSSSLKSENSLKKFMFTYSKRTPKNHSALEEMGRIGITTQNATQASMYPFPILRIRPIETTSQMSNSQCSFTLPSIHPFASPEGSISPSSTVAEAGSMESIPRDTTGSSRENGQHSPETIYPVSLNRSESQVSTNESLYSDNGTKNIKYTVNPNSYCFPFKGNSTYPKSASEENGQNNSALKNRSTLKTSMFTVKRKCSSQLKTDPLPSNTSTSRLPECKYIVNTTGCINRLALYPDQQYPRPEARLPGNSKAENEFLEENDPSYFIMSRYPEEHTGESLATLNTIKSQSSLDQRSCIGIVESLRQSFISLSMTPTDALEMSIPSNIPDSKQSTRNRNKTRKECKLISCFASCFRSSSPRQESEI